MMLSSSADAAAATAAAAKGETEWALFRLAAAVEEAATDRRDAKSRSETKISARIEGDYFTHLPVPGDRPNAPC